MVAVEIELDVPEGVEVRGYERIDEGHAFEVSWPLPETLRCDCCGRSQPTHVQYGEKIHVIRDLDVWGQPSFFVYQPPYHRCVYCNHRQWLLPPFKRKNVTCTYRFEQEVLRRLIGSSEEEVAGRLGISAEMVATIVRHQLQEEPSIDLERKITDVGIVGEEGPGVNGAEIYVPKATGRRMTPISFSKITNGFSAYHVDAAGVARRRDRALQSVAGSRTMNIRRVVGGKFPGAFGLDQTVIL